MHRYEGQGWGSRELWKSWGGPQTTENMAGPPNGGHRRRVEGPELDRAWVPQSLKRGGSSAPVVRVGSPIPGSLAHFPFPALHLPFCW